MIWLLAVAGTSLIAGPIEQIASINKAIHAESAITLQCKSLVKDYVPQIVDMIQKLPIDQVCSKLGLCPKPSFAETVSSSKTAPAPALLCPAQNARRLTTHIVSIVVMLLLWWAAMDGAVR